MATNKSIIQEVELANGMTIYVQANGKRASISIDGAETQYSLWLKFTELEDLRNIINAALEEISQL